MEKLTSGQLELMNHKLLSIKHDLEEQLLISKDTADVVLLDQTMVGRLSRIDAMQQQSMAVSTRQKIQLKLRKVQAALAALEDGDYGYCRKCHELIGYARLDAYPEANLCLACQNEADQHG